MKLLIKLYDNTTILQHSFTLNKDLLETIEIAFKLPFVKETVLTNEDVREDDVDYCIPPRSLEKRISPNLEDVIRDHIIWARSIKDKDCDAARLIGVSSRVMSYSLRKYNIKSREHYLEEYK